MASSSSRSVGQIPTDRLNAYVERQLERFAAEDRAGAVEVEVKDDDRFAGFPADLKEAGMNLRRTWERIRKVEKQIHGNQLALYDASYNRSRPGNYSTISEKLTNLDSMHTLLMEEERAKRQPFLVAAIAHSKAYCQELTAAIMQTLPREIRNMIYDYLCQKVVRISVYTPDEGRANWVGPGGTEGNPSYRSYLDRCGTSLPYLFSHKYFAKDFLFELVSELYSRVTFHIWDAADIENFLTQDFFGVGCLPKDSACALSLVIFNDQYEQRCSSKRDIQQKLSHLSKLFQIKRQQGFRLDLHLCISTQMHRPTVPRFHQILLPYLYEFKNAGFTIRLPIRKYTYGRGQKVTRREMNQLQAGNSTRPEDWIVDDDELQAWQESEVIQKAFKRSAMESGWYYDDEYYDYDSDEERPNSPNPLPSDFEDESVASDEEVE